MKNIIEAIGITKIYGKHYKGNNTIGHPYSTIFQAKVASILNKNPETIALDNVTLSIQEGEFICIMGPSGSGKTTLLKNISTIDMPTKGKVMIEGKNVRSMGDIAIGKFRQQYLGFVFQNFSLLDNLTVFENIALPLSLAKTAESEIEIRVQEVAKTMGIEDILEKNPMQCSGGQCQRVAIARALVTNPKLIVADEPTGNLDSKNSHEILKLLKKLNQKEGVTILMVTHDAMIASYAKRLLFITDGKIETTLERKEMTQKEFYYAILDVTSHEAIQLLEES